MKKVAIIDYKAGNLDSVARMVEKCGGEAVITDNPRDLEKASSIILPGVGSFAEGMRSIRQLGFEKTLRYEVIERKTPFLGICLGMQLLALKGYEGGEVQGFGWIDGEARRLEPERPDEKIPHIGWNEVIFAKERSPLFKEIPSGKDFYFVHSYNLVCNNEDEVLARTPYCGSFVSAIERGNIFGVQFHPEKSLRLGIRLISNFLSL